MKDVFTVISFGNFETKILVLNLLKGKIYPIYKSSFMTKTCFDKSIIVDIETLQKILSEEIGKMPININKTKIIFNIPIKKLILKDYISDEYAIKSVLTTGYWDKIQKTQRDYYHEKNLLLLDSKPYLYIVNKERMDTLPFGKEIQTLSYRSKHYLVNKNQMLDYYEIADNLKLKISSYLCDSLIMNKLFKNNRNKFKLLINVGHYETSFDLYDEFSLLKQNGELFGIRNLTSKISNEANIDELTAIDLLKIYKDMISIDSELPLINHFKEKFLDYSQTKIKHISAWIKKWLKDFAFYTNNQINEYSNRNIQLEDIYIYSSTNIFKTWIDYINSELKQNYNIVCLESNLIGIEESKFISLIATIIHYKKEINNK